MSTEKNHNGDGRLLKLAFLKSSTPMLVRGDLLAFIIPQRNLRLAESDLPPLCFTPEPVYSLLPAPLKGAGGRHLKSATRRPLEWGFEDFRATQDG